MSPSFDVYEGRQIAADKKSMAFTVLFTPKEEAFKADTVDGYVKKVLKHNKNLIMDCQSYTKYRPNETTGGIFCIMAEKGGTSTGA